MFRIQLKAPADRSKLRQWSPTAMTNAYNFVKETGSSVYAAAKKHGVPISTLRDRIDQRIGVYVTKSGPEPLLSLHEEGKLTAHLKELAAVGYGYTRPEVISIATDYAVALGKRSYENPLSLKWFYGFMSRWPELKLVKPSSLSEQRAKCASEETLKSYFNELGRILMKYDLHNKPENIYNIDEKGINTEVTPPYVVSGRDCKPQAIMAERSKTVTVIGAGSAAGQQIPPFFVFPGSRMTDGLLDGKSPGADGMMSPSGWSNGQVFKRYLTEHFIKYCTGRNNDYLLVLYDGHRSHISLDLVEWAKQHNIVLFVLPPHTSHILQPMDIGCFGPLQLKYAQECTKFARLNHRVVTRYDVCSLVCKAYTVALSAGNLQASFRKAGIYPYLTATEMIDSVKMKITPSTLYAAEDSDSIGPGGDADRPISRLNSPAPSTQTEPSAAVPENIFDNRRDLVVKKVKKRKINTINSVVGGKALEGTTEENMRAYLSCGKKKEQKRRKTDKSPKPSAPSRKEEVSVSTRTSKATGSSNTPVPGPSAFYVSDSNCSSDMDSDDEAQMPDSDKCCQCHRYYVNRDDHQIVGIVNWAQCDKCDHWVHLKYCTPVRVVRKNTEFTCACCY